MRCQKKSYVATVQRSPSIYNAFHHLPTKTKNNLRQDIVEPLPKKNHYLFRSMICRHIYVQNLGEEKKSRTRNPNDSFLSSWFKDRFFFMFYSKENRQVLFSRNFYSTTLSLFLGGRVNVRRKEKVPLTDRRRESGKESPVKKA